MRLEKHMYEKGSINSNILNQYDTKAVEMLHFQKVTFFGKHTELENIVCMYKK